jgi:hypothetical protein
MSVRRDLLVRGQERLVLVALASHQGCYAHRCWIIRMPTVNSLAEEDLRAGVPSQQIVLDHSQPQTLGDRVERNGLFHS